MRVLIVTRDLPYPPLDGYQLVTWHMLRELSHRCTFDIVSFVPGDPIADSLTAVRRYAEHVALVPLREFRTPQSSICNLQSAICRFLHARLSALPSDVLRCSDGMMAETVRSLANQWQSDLIYLNAPALGFYAPMLSRLRPLVIAPLDARSRQLPALGELSKNPLLRLRTREQLRKTRNFESTYYAHSDACLVVSHRDQETLLRLRSTLPVRLVPLGVDADLSSLAPCPSPDTYDLAFSGNLDYDPNHEAAMSLILRIVPEIRKSHPSARLGLIGAHPRAALLKVASVCTGVTVTGFVPSIAQELGQARVFVCPVTQGSGVRVKIMEAMALGLPIVCYPINTEELPVSDGEHVLLARNESEFITNTNRLLTNPELARKLGQAARQLITQQFTWRQTADRLMEILEQSHADGLRRIGASVCVRLCGSVVSIPESPKSAQSAVAGSAA